MSACKKKEKAVAMKEYDDESIIELADLAREGLIEEYKAPMEPFEEYTHQLKSKFVVNQDHFRSRFAKGYHALVESILS